MQRRLQPMLCAGVALLSEKLEPRSGLPPLLTNLGDRPPESLHYLGTSFGLTQNLLNFWRKSGFAPVYLRQNASDITGEIPASCKKSRQFRYASADNRRSLWSVQRPVSLHFMPLGPGSSTSIRCSPEFQFNTDCKPGAVDAPILCTKSLDLVWPMRMRLLQASTPWSC